MRAYSEAIRRTVEALQPSAVIASGDLVELAEHTAAWQQVAAFLRCLGVPVATVPGNHDIERLDLFTRLRDPLAAYRRHIHPEVDRVVTVPGATLICLSTPKRWTFDLGYVSPEQLQWVRDACEAAPPGNLRVVVMHHGLRQLGRGLVRNRVRGERRAEWTFAEAGVDLVMSGHNHFPHLLRLGHGRGFLWAQAGTAGTRRFHNLRFLKPSLNWIEATEHEIRVDWLFLSKQEDRFWPGAWHRFHRSSLRAVGQGAADLRAADLRVANQPAANQRTG